MASGRGHRWVKLRFLPWPVCCKCGLVGLHNVRTRLAIAGRCEGDE